MPLNKALQNVVQTYAYEHLKGNFLGVWLANYFLTRLSSATRQSPTYHIGPERTNDAMKDFSIYQRYNPRN